MSLPVIPVRKREWPVVVWTGSFAFLAVALAITLRTWSDTAFLSTFDVRWLPAFFVVSAVVFVPATFAYAWAVKRLSGVWLNTVFLTLFTGFVLACFSAQGSRWPVFAAVLGLSIVSPLANVICWNTILDRLDSRQARRLIPIVGGLGTLGAIAAGGLGGELARAYGPDVLLWVAIGLLVIMVPLPRLITGAWRRPGSTRGGSRGRMREGLRVLGSNQLLMVVTFGTFLMALTTNLIDYQFKAHIQMSLDRDAMSVFLARFHGGTNLAVLLVQFLVVPRVLRRFGVGLAAVLHPAAVLLCAAVTVAVPALATVVALRFVDTLLKFTFDSDTDNLVMTPVPVKDRYQAKVFLKGIIYPVGGLMAGAVLPAADRLGMDPANGTGILVVGLGLLWCWVASQIRASYLDQVSERLSITIIPGRQMTPTPPGELMSKLKGQVQEVRRLRKQARREIGMGPASTELEEELEILFSTVGRLVGDRPAVAAAADRFLHGTGKDRSRAVELFDLLLHGYRVPDAARLLESLASDDLIMDKLEPNGSEE